VDVLQLPVKLIVLVLDLPKLILPVTNLSLKCIPGKLGLPLFLLLLDFNLLQLRFSIEKLVLGCFFLRSNAVGNAPNFLTN
jgi:hypothetical protein